MTKQFYELIHTRCNQGMDLSQNKEFTKEGFKEYGYSPQLAEADVVDLPLFTEVVRIPQPFSDPEFMEDAYSYYAPDRGQSFLINFYPIKWQKEFDVQGRFVNRPGNFTNQAFVGDFSERYLYEWFGDKSWDAKGRDYDYYYATPPPDSLPPRAIAPRGKYSFAKIGEFIKDGRENALKNAVAFICEQFTKAPKDQKYLVIRDANAENIEKWIAAIQCAFSPRMAARIPFATRMPMDNFVFNNRYMVNEAGQYQIHPNMQDPHQSPRFKALLVGADVRDKKTQVRHQANSDFALLDSGKMSVEFDVSNKYFEIITGFDKRHEDFCTVFLQSIKADISLQTLPDLCEVYTVTESVGSAQALAAVLGKLDPYGAAGKLHNSVWLESVCNRIEAAFPKYLESDPVSTMQIAKWLVNVSGITGKKDVASRINSLAKDALKGLVFNDARSAVNLWKQLKDTSFAETMANVVVENTSRSHKGADLFVLYLQCSAFLKKTDKKTVEALLVNSFADIIGQNTQDAVNKLIDWLDKFGMEPCEILLVALRHNREIPPQKAEIVVGCLADRLNVLATDNDMMNFCVMLAKYDLGGFIYDKVVKKRLAGLDMAKAADFIELLYSEKYTKEEILGKACVELDKQIDPMAVQDKTAVALADKMIRRSRHGEFTNAAHLMALKFALEINNASELLDRLDSLRRHNFPEYQDKKYVTKLVLALAALADVRNLKDMFYIMELLVRSRPEIYFDTLAAEVIKLAKKHKDAWHVFIGVVTNEAIREVGGRGTFDNASVCKRLINIFAGLNDEKLLNSLGSDLPKLQNSDSIMDCFDAIKAGASYYGKPKKQKAVCLRCGEELTGFLFFKKCPVHKRDYK